MDIGKLPPLTTATFSGDAKKALPEMALELNRLHNEMSNAPGTAKMTASVTITTGQAVNIFNGQLRLADAAGSIPAIGIALAGAASGTKCRFMIGSGYVSGLTGLTANTSVYLGNAGAKVYAKPGAGFIQGLGYALSATEMFVTISQP